MRNGLLSAALLTAALLFAAILGEIGLRLLGYAGAPQSFIGNTRRVEDPILNWRFVPHSTVQDGKVVYKYNSAGFRDEDHSTEKPSGVTRLVVIGDSVTEGSGVRQEELFSSYLQSLLGSTYEVINLGMSGLNTPQEVHLLEVEGLKYRPDVVLMNFVLNDCDFFSELQAAERFQNEKDTKIGLFGDIAVDPRLKRWLKSSALVHFVRARVEYIIGIVTGKEEKGYYAALWGNPGCRNRVADGFNALQKLQQQYRFSVHILIWPLLINYDRYEFSHVHEWVKGIAEERGFKALDLQPVFASRWYRDLQVTAEDNVHPNGVGHQLTAQTYVDWAAASLNKEQPLGLSQ